MNRSIIKGILIGLCAGILCGCTGVPTQGPLPTLAHNESFVFGRITMVRITPQDQCKIFVKENNQEMANPLHMSRDGLFCWKLKPGEYTIISYQFKNRWGRIWVDFKVPSADQYYYIGSLTLREGFVSKISIENDYDFDIDEIINHFGVEKDHLEVKLMTKEKL